jgi:hypothetical protein
MVVGCFFSPHFQKGGSTMEPRQEEQKDKVPQTEEKEAKPRRFRIVKLEERIAPGGPGTGDTNHCTAGLATCCSFCHGHHSYNILCA